MDCPKEGMKNITGETPGQAPGEVRQEHPPPVLGAPIQADVRTIAGDHQILLLVPPILTMDDGKAVHISMLLMLVERKSSQEQKVLQAAIASSILDQRVFRFVQNH